jgi:arylsulfatase A-like enzyme
LPELLGSNAPQKKHPFLCWYFDEAGGKRAVLKWPWKLIHLNTDSEKASTQPIDKNKSAKAKRLVVQLFNLENDPTESTNAADANPQIVEELTVQMKQAWREP